ncbi:hypothetical protein J6590_015117 [Homalodisca vitripennis]|nr:hypothetical protein J6590_015117 [Homalodisca vitripennis]
MPMRVLQRCLSDLSQEPQKSGHKLTKTTACFYGGVTDSPLTHYYYLEVAVACVPALYRAADTIMTIGCAADCRCRAVPCCAAPTGADFTPDTLSAAMHLLSAEINRTVIHYNGLVASHQNKCYEPERIKGIRFYLNAHYSPTRRDLQTDLAQVGQRLLQSRTAIVQSGSASAPHNNRSRHATANYLTIRAYHWTRVCNGKNGMAGRMQNALDEKTATENKREQKGPLQRDRRAVNVWADNRHQSCRPVRRLSAE